MDSGYPDTYAASGATPTSTSHPWWRGASIYQIYPRSFYDSNDDGIGDLPGITSKLDHIANLGFDAIWLSPFFTSPMRDFGYDVSDYCDVDPVFGTLSDFDQLVDRAHELKLKVIIDQVYCHTSDLHAWFSESRTDRVGDKSDWYVWADASPDGSPPSNWMSVFGGPAWTWDARRQQYYLHHFLKEQPTLNLHNKDVINALIDVGRFWIDRGVDGFRLDALNVGMHDRALRNNPPAPNAKDAERPYLMQTHTYTLSQPEMLTVVETFSAAFRAAGGDDFFTVGELGGEHPFDIMKLYTSGSSRLSTAYSFDFIGTRSLNTDHVLDTFGLWPDDPSDGYPAWALSNHDCPRVASRWAVAGAPTEIVQRMLVLLEAAMPGIIFVYQGEELGLPQANVPFDRLVDPEAIANWPHDQGRDGARTPMPWSSTAPNGGFTNGRPWLPIDADHLSLSVEAQTADAGSFMHFLQAAIGLRQNSEALRFGVYRECMRRPAAFVFERRSATENVVCAFNFGPEPMDLSDVDKTDPVRFLSVGLDDATGLPSSLPAFSGFLSVSEI